MHRVLGVRVHRTRDDRCSCKRDAGSPLRSFPVHVGRLRLHSACINPRDQHREAPSSAMPNIAFAQTAARTRDEEDGSVGGGSLRGGNDERETTEEDTQDRGDPKGCVRTRASRRTKLLQRENFHLPLLAMGRVIDPYRYFLDFRFH